METTIEYIWPHGLETLHLNCAVASPAATVKLYDAVVAPVPAVTLIQVLALSLLLCHWYEGLVTAAATVRPNEATSPTCLPGCDTGWLVIAGGVHTESVAAAEVAGVKHPVETTQRYFDPFRPVADVKVKTGVMAPV
jgi:hypothetical protein